jgi:signal transduction histidine kinase
VVADQGSGIADEMMPRLFQFGASSKGERGNGMGLWLVKQLITRHGGTIEVESKPGEGARFIVNWPRQMPDEADEEHNGAAGLKAS